MLIGLLLRSVTKPFSQLVTQLSLPQSRPGEEGGEEVFISPLAGPRGRGPAQGHTAGQQRNPHVGRACLGTAMGRPMGDAATRGRSGALFLGVLPSALCSSPCTRVKLPAPPQACDQLLATLTTSSPLLSFGAGTCRAKVSGMENTRNHPDLSPLSIPATLPGEPVPQGPAHAALR